jgi:ParB family chromosome partitioning protein
VVKRSRLGRGLSALLPEEEAPAVKPAVSGKDRRAGAELLIPLDRLRANPGQPRKHFDDAELAELAASIREHGVIQPVIVDEEDGGYIIIAGERRTRAARLAGLGEIPVVVRRYSDRQRLEIALVENIHRADLNPVEEAVAYRELMERSGLSQDEAAARVGKNRSTVANALRLLKLPGNMRDALEEGALSAGHARAILSVTGAAAQEKLFAEISAKNLSVRQAEDRAAELSGRGKKTGKTPAAGTVKRDPELKAMEDRFIQKLGTKVAINGTLKKGRVEIDYYSMDDLDRLCRLLGDS